VSECVTCDYSTGRCLACSNLTVLHAESGRCWPRNCRSFDQAKWQCREVPELALPLARRLGLSASRCVPQQAAALQQLHQQHARLHVRAAGLCLPEGRQLPWLPVAADRATTARMSGRRPPTCAASSAARLGCSSTASVKDAVCLGGRRVFEKDAEAACNCSAVRGCQTCRVFGDRTLSPTCLLCARQWFMRQTNGTNAGVCVKAQDCPARHHSIRAPGAGRRLSPTLPVHPRQGDHFFLPQSINPSSQSINVRLSSFASISPRLRNPKNTGNLRLFNPLFAFSSSPACPSRF
jgi:hypothetical protein